MCLCRSFLVCYCFFAVCLSATAQEGRRIAAKPATCWVLAGNAPERMRVDYEYSLDFLLNHWPKHVAESNIAWITDRERVAERNCDIVQRDGWKNLRMYYTLEDLTEARSVCRRESAEILLWESCPDWFQPVCFAFCDQANAAIEGRLIATQKRPLECDIEYTSFGSAGSTTVYHFDLQRRRPRFAGQTRIARRSEAEFDTIGLYYFAGRKMYSQIFSPPPVTEGRRIAERPATCHVLGEGEPDSLRVDYEYSLDFLRSNFPGEGGHSIQWTPVKGNVGELWEEFVVQRDGSRCICFRTRPVNSWNWIELLLFESRPGWFQPVYLLSWSYDSGGGFNGHLVSNRKHSLAYTVRISFSGTGSIRIHYLFDLRKPRPRLIASATGGRLRREDFGSEEAYERASRERDKAEERASGE